MKWYSKLIASVVLVVMTGVSCGEATDKPEDCTDNEYFDEGRELCRTCPAIAEPTCREGCGFAVESDSRGCAVAVCALDC